MLKRIVDGLQLVGLALVALTVALLFRAGPAAPAGLATDTIGAEVFSANCARCHGATGTGLTGPDLTTGNVFERFEDRAATIAFIGAGQGDMPGFEARLTPGEIGAVADFVRTELAR